jgi:hypothetical protein
MRVLEGMTLFFGATTIPSWTDQMSVFLSVQRGNGWMTTFSPRRAI